MGWNGSVVSLDPLHFCLFVPDSKVNVDQCFGSQVPRSHNIRLVTNQSLSWLLHFFGASAISRAYADDAGMAEDVPCIKARTSDAQADLSRFRCAEMMKTQEWRSEVHEETSDGKSQSTGAARVVVARTKSAVGRLYRWILEVQQRPGTLNMGHSRGSRGSQNGQEGLLQAKNFSENRERLSVSVLATRLLLSGLVQDHSAPIWRVGHG